MAELINTIEKIIKVLGTRTKANQAEVILYVQANNFTDDFIGDIYGFYLIDGLEVDEILAEYFGNVK